MTGVLPRSGTRSRVGLDVGVRPVPKTEQILVPDTELVTSPIVGEPRPPRIRDPTTIDPTPRPGGFRLPRRDRAVFSQPSIQRSGKGFFGALKTAFAGSDFVIAPGRKSAGKVRTIRLGGVVGDVKSSRKKKKEFWWEL